KRRLIQEGADVIDDGAGDADLAPPRAAVEALARAARDPAMSRYAFQLGLPAFREAAAAYLQRRFGVKCDPFTELHPLLGSKEGIAHLAMALLDVGDVAVVPEPGYAVYEGGTVLAGGESYRYALTPRTAFLLELEEVRADAARLFELSQQPYGGCGDARVSRAHGRFLSAARHRDRVRQPVLRDHVRRLRRAQHLRDPRGMGLRGRVSLALEDVLYDGVAARLGGGARGAHRRLGARQELRRHGRVPRGAGGGRGRAAAGRTAGPRVRRAVPRAAGRHAAGAARPGVRARDAAGHAVLVGAAPRRPLLGHVPAPRTRRGRRRDRAGERVRRGRRRVFPDRAHRG